MMHHDAVNKINALEDSVPEDPQPGVVHVDIGKWFITKHEFTLHKHMF